MKKHFLIFVFCGLVHFNCFSQANNYNFAFTSMQNMLSGKEQIQFPLIKLALYPTYVYFQ